MIIFPLKTAMQNRFRHIARMIFLAFLLCAGAMPPSLKAAPSSYGASPESHTLEATRTDVPSWESLGLEDLLAPPTECSMSAPQSVPVHNGGSAHQSCASPMAQQPRPATRQLHAQPSRSSCPNDYYLYFLYRLRL